MGTKGRPGIVAFADRWLFLHIAVGLLLAKYVAVPLNEVANSFLLPLAGILIGLVFAWGGNATALLQTDEIEDMTMHHPEGFEYYLFKFQTAILVVMAILIAWGFAGLRLYELAPSHRLQKAVAVLLYASSSVAMRECWHVVLMAQGLLLARRQIREKKTKNGIR